MGDPSEPIRVVSGVNSLSAPVAGGPGADRPPAAVSEVSEVSDPLSLSTGSRMTHPPITEGRRRARVGARVDGDGGSLTSLITLTEWQTLPPATTATAQAADRSSRSTVAANGSPSASISMRSWVFANAIRANSPSAWGLDL
jgi:hypothetical protein